MTDDILYNYLLMSLNLNSKLKPIIFNHPKESRFKDLFSNMKIKKKRKTMSVNPKNVMLGIDRRTSIIIKNIPEDITSDQFKSIVMQYNPLIDFFYVPIKIRTRKRLRVAFVNVLNYSQIVPIYMGLIYKSKFVYNSHDIEMEICYSKVQGKNQLMKRFFHEFQFNI